MLGFDSLNDYERYNGKIHFGALIGRYANRIADGQFTLNGQTYRLPVNEPPNTLHGRGREARCAVALCESGWRERPAL